MGKAARFYIITDDGTIRRLAFLKFYGIVYERARVPFADLAGKRVRYAQLTVRFKQRKAVAVCRAYFGYLTFDNDGIFDLSEWNDLPEQTPGTLTMPTLLDTSLPIDPIWRYAALRRAQAYDWEPTQELRRKLFARVAGRPRPRAQN
jgi:hypothetical protein